MFFGNIFNSEWGPLIHSSRITVGIMQITLHAYNKWNTQSGEEKERIIEKTQQIGMFGYIYPIKPKSLILDFQ